MKSRRVRFRGNACGAATCVSYRKRPESDFIDGADASLGKQGFSRGCVCGETAYATFREKPVFPREASAPSERARPRAQ